MTKIDNSLANFAVALHAALEQTQQMIDTLQGTNLYRHSLKKACNNFARELDATVKNWYETHLPAPKKVVEEWTETDRKRAEFIKTYQTVCVDLENAITSLLSHSPATWKLIPHFLEALKNDEVKIV